MASTTALTTPSTWHVSLVEDGGLETIDLHIVLKSVFPQRNIEIKKKDDITFRVRLPYCSKLATIKSKFGDYESAINIVSAEADLSIDETKRFAELKREITQKNNGLNISLGEDTLQNDVKIFNRLQPAAFN